MAAFDRTCSGFGQARPLLGQIWDDIDGIRPVLRCLLGMSTSAARHALLTYGPIVLALCNMVALGDRALVSAWGGTLPRSLGSGLAHLMSGSLRDVPAILMADSSMLRPGLRQRQTPTGGQLW